MESIRNIFSAQNFGSTNSSTKFDIRKSILKPRVNEVDRTGRFHDSSQTFFTDEIEGELEKYSVFGVHLTRRVVASMCGLILAIVIGIIVALTTLPSTLYSSS